MNEKIIAALRAYFSRPGNHFAERPLMDDETGEYIPGKINWVIDGDYDPEEMGEFVRIGLSL